MSESEVSLEQKHAKIDHNDIDQTLQQNKISILLEEYKIANEHNMRRLDADARGFEVVIIGIGVVVAASSMVLDLGAFVLLLLLAIPFYVLAWHEARKTLSGLNLISYITTELTPKINSIFEPHSNDSSPQEHYFHSWEGYLMKQLDSQKAILGILPTLATLGKVLMYFCVISSLVGAYLVARNDYPQYSPSILDTLLLALNMFLFLISTLIFFSVFQYAKYPRTTT